jgi:sugar phosphate permease
LAWVSNLIGWRMTLVTVGAASLVTALLVYGFVRNRPSDVGLATTWPAPEGGPANKRMSLLEGVKLVVVSGRFWALALWVFSTAGISFALGALWGGPYLMHVYGLSKAQASGVLSMYAFALIIGSPFVGWLSNQIGRKPILLGNSLILIAVCGLFYLFTDGLSLTTIHILYFLLQLAGAASASVATAVGKELFPVSIAGTSVGLLNTFPFLGGGVFQVVAGAIVTRTAAGGGTYTTTGYQNMFLFYLLAAIVSLVVVFFLRETLSRRET